jgi:hypothetical protein
MLQELRKQDNEEFPPICPYAYAYVYWKHTLLQTEHFYMNHRWDETNPRKYLGLEFTTELIISIILEYKDKLFSHTNFFEVDNRELLHWIINRVTVELCLNYFYQWLKIASEGANDKRVPDWTQVRTMIEKSLPTIIFKVPADVSQKMASDVIIQKAARLENSIEMICPLGSKSIRKAFRNMKSFTPLSVAMLIFNDPSIENKTTRSYVDQYVKRLTI